MGWLFSNAKTALRRMVGGTNLFDFKKILTVLQSLESLETNEIRNCIEIAEKQKNELIKKKAENEEDFSTLLDVLFFLYVYSNMVLKSCQLIAEYNINLDELDIRLRGFIASYDKLVSCELGLFYFMYQKMIKSDESYERYLDLYKSYPTKEYAKLLLLYARYEDRRVDTLLLSDGIINSTVQEGQDRISGDYYNEIIRSDLNQKLLPLYTERLNDLMFLRDYNEISKSLHNAKKIYEAVKFNNASIDATIESDFLTSVLGNLIILKKYDSVININRTRKIVINDYRYYYYLAEAFYSKGSNVLAREYCERSVALNRNNENELLLAYILFKDQKYSLVEETLYSLIGNLKTRNDSIRKYHNLDYKKRMESPYVLLLLCYVHTEKWAKASAFYQDMKKEIESSDLTVIAGYLLRMEQYSSTHVAEIEEEKEILRKELEEVVERTKSLETIIQIWTRKLNEFQLFEDVELSEDFWWEDNMAEKMDAMLAEITSRYRKTNPKDYQNKYNEIKNTERFRNMPQTAIEFLTSAELMYEIFKGNNIIDFAPIIVEYCKVFEVLIWNYLDKTGEYADEIATNKRKDKCLGTAGYVIANSVSLKPKSLKKYSKLINRITDIRNKGAHKQYLKEHPSVKEIRKYLFGSLDDEMQAKMLTILLQ